MTVIVLSGLIGAGKSSLTKILADELHGQAFYENVDGNPILPLFYKDMSKYTFLLNVYLMNHRLEQINCANKMKNSVIDHSIYEDSVFFKMNVDNGIADSTEFKIYRDLVNNMMEDVPGSVHKKPDLLIYIHASLDTMLKHIKQRGRIFEQLSTDPKLEDYYACLNSHYDPWFEQYDASDKLMIDGDKYDFVNDVSARKIVVNQVMEKLRNLGKL